MKTFRDSDGLWNNHSIYEVATPEAWKANPTLVLDFYNHRRKELESVLPNDAHLALAEFEKFYEVTIITQNVDDLHERAGSSNVLHLHGQLTQARGTDSLDSIINIGYKDIFIEDYHPNGEQLRPHIVWFGEDVPKIEDAAEICSQADIFIIIGTSLNVYPTAGLVDIVPLGCKIYLIDPKADEVASNRNLTVIKEKAGTAVPALLKNIM